MAIYINMILSIIVTSPPSCNCAFIRKDACQVNFANYQEIKEGMARGEVDQILGGPAGWLFNKEDMDHDYLS